MATNSGPPAGTVDRRVRRTRQAIQRALIELILDKGYDQVTVSDLIRRADVGRSTFYAHFDSKQAVLLANLDELTFLHAVPSADGPLFAFARPMFEHVHDQRDLVRALLGRRSGRAVMAHGEQVLQAVVRDELLARGVRASTRLDLVVTCVVGAFMAMLAKWVDGEISATAAELEAAFRAAVVPGVRALAAQP
ncbi:MULTISPECIES: TetR/AcrR family transcriptional regulator [Streptosporangium]|uniref:AcrR family transcriptional regulator n=1 Tax=Streptosporangium brasiliense TaxID=47480 RepID=A0ABT9RGZ6_9ACTN|nr:TetR/AcrR family transcriptional regulator [Streptosporangium brasiliense]MDP9868557.1 AcrR family transcriptional regulator [Streptosporangium brasiliense]